MVPGAPAGVKHPLSPVLRRGLGEFIQTLADHLQFGLQSIGLLLQTLFFGFRIGCGIGRTLRSGRKPRGEKPVAPTKTAAEKTPAKAASPAESKTRTPSGSGIGKSRGSKASAISGTASGH